MSRIGRKPIPLTGDVTVTNESGRLIVKGPKGTLERTIHKDMIVHVSQDQIVVERPSDHKFHRSLHGTTRSVIANMVQGVTQGYAKTLELVGVGYRASKSGDKLVLSVGYSHPVEIVPDASVLFEVPANNRIIVKGIDKEVVGAYAAKIRDVRPPEPYKGKGIKYENERILRKEGKTGGKKK